MSPQNKLMTSYQMGKFPLKHRVVMPALARERCNEQGIPPPEAAIYYGQRASEGGFLVAEATAISVTARGFSHAPGIWMDEQIKAWKHVVQAVHEKRAFFFLQLMHVGRASHANHLDGEKLTLSSTSKKLKPITRVSGVDTVEFAEPKRMEGDDFGEVIQEYKVAARNAIEAGFDGVELHGAHGYLLDQFMKEEANDRTDDYGGTLKNRCRFPLEVVDAICQEIGPDRVGVRLSPFSGYKECADSKPEELGVYMAKELNKRSIVYLHMIEPRMTQVGEMKATPHSLRPMKEAFKATFIAAGGYNREDGNKAIEEGLADLIAYGRFFIANPDLPKRFEVNAPLNKYDRSTFYLHDPHQGYIDYPFLDSAVTSRECGRPNRTHEPSSKLM